MRSGGRYHAPHSPVFGVRQTRGKRQHGQWLMVVLVVLIMMVKAKGMHCYSTTQGAAWAGVCMASVWLVWGKGFRRQLLGTDP